MIDVPLTPPFDPAALTFIAMIAGAGAWFLFDQIRFFFPQPETPPKSRVVQWLYRLLYLDAMAHLSVGAIAFILAFALALGAALWFETSVDWRIAAVIAWTVATNIHHWRKTQE